MKKLLTFAFAIFVGMAISADAYADIMDNSGGPLDIADGDPAGTTSTIVIAANEIIVDVDVTLFEADHTWVGDLTVRITSPSGTTADLMVRTGSVTNGGPGDSTNLDGTYTFSDGGDDWWDMADGLDDNQAIASGTYGATSVGIPNTSPPVGTPVSLAALFAGEQTAGTWILFASDSLGGDTASDGGNEIESWGLSITSTSIPEPGSLTLLGLMGMACFARRRR